MSPDTLKVVIAASSGLLVGGFVGYVVTQRVLTTKYEEELDREVERIKTFYKKKYETTEEVPESSEVEKEEVPEDVDPEYFEYVKSVTKEGYTAHGYGTEYTEADIVVKKETKEVPPLMDPEPIDYESDKFKEMVSKRSPDVPYIITVDEFMDDYPEFDKTCLTYFEEDDILCDTREHPIPDIEATVGLDSLVNFGLYSKDKNIVYVRNERISSDFEIAFDPGSYLETVAGFKREEEIIRRMKEDD